MRRLAAAVALCAALASGCGGSSSAGGPDRIDVAAAASLSDPVTAYARQFGRDHDVEVRVRFGGSDELAAQIRQGVPADVFLSADAVLPAELARAGLLDRPEPFASNRLAIAADPAGPVRSLPDLARPGVVVALGSDGVPVGKYARHAIARLPQPQRVALLRNVKSSEPDVKGVLAKVVSGAADAGIVYVTDARAARAEVHTVALPRSLQPAIRYDAGVAVGASPAGLARRFVEGLRSGAGAHYLRAAGFGPVP
ncbi:MAG: molybdate ABC transporter substrate-binding protein [Thermoleophilaceae bacterium]|nr:molybdate ABC transporter substrate-binding protein [Thermoleophilaceae bacterium]